MAILPPWAPGKRPRLTPAPALALKDINLCLPCGYGGDHICRTLQVFLNLSNSASIRRKPEAPRFYSYSFPNSAFLQPTTRV